MRNKIIILLFILLLTGCSTTIVYAPKTVYIQGNENQPQITGSDLKGNSATQKSAFDWFLEIPFLK